MVVLQRCRLQYSLFRPILPSLHRPLGALGSNPPFHCGAFWCSTNTAYRAVPLRGAIVSMGLRGVQGGLRGEIEIFPGPPAKNVIKELPSLLFISTPQSIAKPSPGWNKVALLTAVRNSPCSCPFSVSLTRPQDALNSEPRERWRLLVRNEQPLKIQQKTPALADAFLWYTLRGSNPGHPD